MTDPFGKAILDYYSKNQPEPLWIHNTFGPPEEMPVAAYFRSYRVMPALEKKALALCRGKVLDIGAGAGSHVLYLQKQGLKVTAMEISSLACEVMRNRGVQNVIEADFFQAEIKKYDTILLLMNGIGLSQTIEGLKNFLHKAASMLQEEGQLIFDSSDVAYLYGEELPPLNHYYGEIEFQYEYKSELSGLSRWIYIDQRTLVGIAKETGWRCEFLMEDRHQQYLVRMQRKV